MEKTRRLLLRIGEYSFLGAIAFLIVRKNSYPWPIKRASDILVLISALSVFSLFAFLKERWQRHENDKKVAIGFGLVLSGVLIATLLGYILDGTNIGMRGTLSVMRILEVGGIVFLVRFFQTKDVDFFKKAALAQLSTVAYLIALVHYDPVYDPAHRFQFLENWPSNVGYYLVVSVSFLVVWMLYALNPLRKAVAPFFAMSAGLSAILLWTQSRASWIGITAAAVIAFIFWTRTTRHLPPRRIVAAAVFLAVLIPLGFLVLPERARNEVLIRVFPQLPHTQELRQGSSADIVKLLTEQKSPPSWNETTRSLLWKTYAAEIIRRPFGLGANYTLVTIGGDEKGPHNTLLELLAMGGVLAASGYVFLLYLAFKRVAKKLAEPGDVRWAVYLLAALSGLAIASLFDNMSTFRLTWILLGFGIYFTGTPHNQHAMRSHI